MRAARLCVQSLRASGREGVRGVGVRLRGRFATEATVYTAHILTTLGVVLLNVGAQIFFQPSAVSTENIFC